MPSGNFASKEMTADATLEALEGTGFTGYLPAEWRFDHLFWYFVLHHYYVRYSI